MSISFTADNFYINGKKLEDILTITEDKKMYTIDTDIINGYDNGQQITEEAHEMLLGKGCPEDWFGKIEGEFEVGDWVVLKRSWETSINSMGDIGRITEIKREANFLGDIKPGAQINGGESGWEPIDYLHHATIEEIKQALTEEAKKRGLIEGATFLDARHGNNKYTIDETFDWYYQEDRDALCGQNSGNGTVYEKGNWAEPIDTTPDIEINGYKAEFHDDYVQFGCAKIDKLFFTQTAEDDGDGWHKTGRGNRKIESIKIGKGEFTLDQIKQIAKYYQ